MTPIDGVTRHEFFAEGECRNGSRRNLFRRRLLFNARWRQ